MAERPNRAERPEMTEPPATAAANRDVAGGPSPAPAAESASRHMPGDNLPAPGQPAAEPLLPAELLSAMEAIIYVAEAPATREQIGTALGVELAKVDRALAALNARYAGDDRGIEIKAVAGGFRMATKPQHHEAVRRFIKALQPPLRLSLPALETLAVVAYRQPVTGPEIKDIRGVDPSGVLNTLLERKLIATAGRKDVIGKPILYRTTQEFLLRFGLGALGELPTLKEFEEMAKAGLEGIEVVSEEESGPVQTES